LVGIDPQQHLRDFVNTLADDLVGNEDLYKHSYPEMYEGAGVKKNVADLHNFMKTFDGLEIPAKKEPPIPEPKPEPKNISWRTWKQGVAN
jgi:hypothetical protein